MKASAIFISQLFLATLLVPSCFAQQAIVPYVIASGGGTAVGDGQRLVATMGQPIAGTVTHLLAGFWQKIDASTVTSVEEGPSDPSIPSVFRLHQNYPNPFNPVTAIGFGLPRGSHVKLSVLDVMGRLVATLLDDDLPPGEHAAAFNASSLPSGTYLYRIEAGPFVESRRMVLLK